MPETSCPSVNSRKRGKSKKIILYSINSKEDFKNICWKSKEIAMKTQITSYTTYKNNKEYFQANVNFIVIKKNNVFKIKKLNIVNIYFKNSNNVSITDRTNEYFYLYDISSSSADNTSSSDSTNNEIEKYIYNQIKTYIYNNLSFEKINNHRVKIIISNNIPNLNDVRLIIKYLEIYPNSSTSKCSKNSSSQSCSKSNGYGIFNIIIIAVIIIFMGLLLSKKNNPDNLNIPLLKTDDDDKNKKK